MQGKCSLCFLSNLFLIINKGSYNNNKDDVSYNNFIAHYNSNYLLQNDEKLKQDFSKIDFLVEM